jgi:hypothetical protein
MCWVLIELLLSRISGQLISIHHSTPRTMEQVHIITILGGYYKAFANQTQTVYLMTEKLIIIYKYIWFIWYMLYIYISTLYIYNIKLNKWVIPSNFSKRRFFLWDDFPSRHFPLLVIISMAISGTDLLEVPIIYKTFASAKFQDISPHSMVSSLTVPQYLDFRVLKLPLIVYFMEISGS